jgi:hypothetical protein
LPAINSNRRNKRRIEKTREALTAEARAWLAGDPCGFFEFKSHDELIPTGSDQPPLPPMTARTVSSGPKSSAPST